MARQVTSMSPITLMSSCGHILENKCPARLCPARHNHSGTVFSLQDPFFCTVTDTNSQTSTHKWPNRTWSMGWTAFHTSWRMAHSSARTHDVRLALNNVRWTTLSGRSPSADREGEHFLFWTWTLHTRMPGCVCVL